MHQIDARAEELRSVAGKSSVDPTPFLGIVSVFGDKLPRSVEFTGKVKAYLKTLSEQGVEGTIRAALQAHTQDC